MSTRATHRSLCCARKNFKRPGAPPIHSSIVNGWDTTTLNRPSSVPHKPELRSCLDSIARCPRSRFLDLGYNKPDEAIIEQPTNHCRGRV
jgi:hypothetical protein